ncbi:Hsp20 family protein [Sphingobium yanoikuyae]|nr:Hsp20 family protein [Sphingobium yanoikuyae]
MTPHIGSSITKPADDPLIPCRSLFRPTRPPLYPDRSDNCFEGRIRLLEDIDRDNANAAFKNGGLTVTLPKMEAANENVRPNPVNGKAA